MCGRYALSLRISHVRNRLIHQQMPVEEAPDDDDDQFRSTYNFAPGYHGLIYRASVGGSGDDSNESDNHTQLERIGDADGDEESPERAKSTHTSSQNSALGRSSQDVKYKLQAARWGFIPFWTKRPPDYSGQMRTINCRDDSLIENRGLWNTSKQRKRCIVVCEGFYEWLKKNNGKERIPHFVKRRDGELMCFAGLWDMVQYEGSNERLYSYTIITTDSNKQLKFLHDRMPVILEPGSDSMKQWLDPSNIGWSKELQSMLKPYNGELECYVVDKAVGKVGNNSASFVIPVDSKENKKNIANFFGTQRATAEEVAAKNEAVRTGTQAASEATNANPDAEEDLKASQDVPDGETNAPMPTEGCVSSEDPSQRTRKGADALDDRDVVNATIEQFESGIKRDVSELDSDSLATIESPPRKFIKQGHLNPSPTKSASNNKRTPRGSKVKSATTNNTLVKAATKEGNAKITSFFGK